MVCEEDMEFNARPDGKKFFIKDMKVNEINSIDHQIEIKICVMVLRELHREKGHRKFSCNSFSEFSLKHFSELFTFLG